MRFRVVTQKNYEQVRREAGLEDNEWGFEVPLPCWPEEFAIIELDTVCRQIDRRRVFEELRDRDRKRELIRTVVRIVNRKD